MAHSHALKPMKHHPRQAVLPQWLWGFLKKNAVMAVAMAAALITSVIVPPDAAYQGYFDLKTLTCLFCVLAVVCALKNIQFFYILAHRIVQGCKNARLSVLALVYRSLTRSFAWRSAVSARR